MRELFRRCTTAMLKMDQEQTRGRMGFDANFNGLHKSLWYFIQVRLSHIHQEKSWRSANLSKLHMSQDWWLLLTASPWCNLLFKPKIYRRPWSCSHHQPGLPFEQALETVSCSAELKETLKTGKEKTGLSRLTLVASWRLCWIWDNLQGMCFAWHLEYPASFH